MKSQEKRNEMRMQRWMCGVMKKGKIRNEHVKVASVAKKKKVEVVRRMKGMC